MTKQIGIFSGVFDPIHEGHVAFALSAKKQAKLDEVYFLVEARPRRKSGVSHHAHRKAMIKLALKPHPELKLLDLPDSQFSVSKTLPRLKQRFQGDKLWFMSGSDMLEHMPEWELVDSMMNQMGLIIGIRGDITQTRVDNLIKSLPVSPLDQLIITSTQPLVSSAKIRDSIHKGKTSPGLLPSVQKYAKSHWLYVSPSSSNSAS